MKKIITLFLGLILLPLTTIQVRANGSTTTRVTYLDLSFSSSTDTIGWTISGDDIYFSSPYNWNLNTNSGYMTCGTETYSDSPKTYTLTSPQIILNDRGADLSFRYCKQFESSTFIVYVLHQGVRHNLLGNLCPPICYFDYWYEVETSLRDYAGDTIQLVFENTTPKRYIYLDDLKVEEPPLCPTAKNLALSALNYNSATVSWDNSTSNTYVMLLASGPVSNPETVSPSDVVVLDTITATGLSPINWTYTLNSLNEGTTYYLYLKSDCQLSTLGYGAWSEGLQFQTPCNAQPLPYIMDFDSLDLGETPSCWMIETAYETPPAVVSPLSGDTVNTSKLFRLSNRSYSDCLVLFPLCTGDIKNLMLSLDAKTELNYRSFQATFQIGLTNNLITPQNFIPLFNQTITDEWGHYNFFFNNDFTLSTSDYYIVLYISSGQTEWSNGFPFQVYLDNITIDLAPSCLFPIQIELSTLSDEGCTISWTDKNSAVTDYTIEYTPEGGTTQTVNTTENPYSLTGLTPNTSYAIRIRSNCSSTDQSPYSDTQYMRTLTSPLVVTIDQPGIEDFEGDTSTFTCLESYQNNASWVIGSALSYSPNHSLYTSNDGGTSYGTLNSNIYAYVNIKIPKPGHYKYSFYHKYKKTTSSSYLQLYLISPDKEIKSNAYYDLTAEGNELICTLANTSTVEAWNLESDTLNFTSAGIYRLLFYRKTGSWGQDYSAIDNFSIQCIACDAPTQLKETSVSATSVGLSWHSTADLFNLKAFSQPIDVDSIDVTTEIPISNLTSQTDSVLVTGLTPSSTYYFYVQAQCDSTHRSIWKGPLIAMTVCNAIELPYTYDFNEDLDGWMPLCWRGSQNTSYVNNNPSEWIDIDGTPVLQLGWDSLNYAILPEFNTPLAQSVLEFDFRSYDAYMNSDLFIGYITNISDFSTYVSLDTLEASSETVHVLETFTTLDSTITGRFVIATSRNRYSATMYNSAIDNIFVYPLSSCWPITSFTDVTEITYSSFTVHWEANPLSTSSDYTVEYGPQNFLPGSSQGTVINVSHPYCTITGLESGTSYDVYVSTNCGQLEGCSSSKMSTFKTLIPPAEGIQYTCNFEDSTENALWTIAKMYGKNTWEIGTQSKFEGIKGLYMVNSLGLLGYDKPYDNCWIYRNLHCIPGLYTVNFKYQCEGKTVQDYMNCVVIPQIFVPRAGNNEAVDWAEIPENWFTGSPISLVNELTWTDYTFQFSVTDETDVTLAFHWYNNGEDYYGPASVDNISVTRTGCCPAYNITLDRLSQGTAHFVWKSLNSVLYEVVVDTLERTNEALDTLTKAVYINRNFTDQAINITGLEDSQTYYLYILNHCSDSTLSNWSSVSSFTTPCACTTLPFQENFETTEANSLPNCWTYFSGGELQVKNKTYCNNTKSLYLETYNNIPLKLALPMVNMPQAIEHYQLVFDAYRIEDMDDFSDWSILVHSAENMVSTQLHSLSTDPIILSKSDENKWTHVVIPFEHPTDSITGQPLNLGTDQIIFLTLPHTAAIYLDALKIEEIPTCSDPYDISINNIEAHQMYCTWKGAAVNYEIQCISADQTDTLTRQISGDSAIVSGLNPQTNYTLQLRALCSMSDHSAWSASTSFQTLATPASIPYFCGFEPSETEHTAWTLLNDHTNQWVIDTVSPFTDNYSLYISNDQLHPSYISTTEQYSYAIRTIHFERGTYDLSFTWSCVGNLQEDYMGIGLFPTDWIPQAGFSIFSQEPNTYFHAQPEGSKVWGHYKDKKSQQTQVETFAIQHSCDINLIIAWNNNCYSNDYDGPMIDDITINEESCPKPLLLNIDHLLDSTATLSWFSTAPSTRLWLTTNTSDTIMDTIVTDTIILLHGLAASTTYTVQLYSICNSTETSALSDQILFTTPCETQTLPFDENFDADSPLPLCWTTAEGPATLHGTTDHETLSYQYSNWIHFTYSNSALNHQCLYIENHCSDWLITPLITLDQEATLSFDLSLGRDTLDNAANKYDLNNKFAVMISRDYGNTWQALSSWENTSEVGHRYCDLPDDFNRISVDVTPNTDQVPIQLAFYGTFYQQGTEITIRLDNIHLNTLSPDTLQILDTICQGEYYPFYSLDLGQEGQYVHIIPATEGQDSVVCLKLTVIPTKTIYTDQFCANSSYPFGDLMLSEAGIYTDTLYNYLNTGCDHIYTLNLQETALDTVEISDQFCEDLDLYTEFGFNIKHPEARDYSFTTTSSVTGCDSTSILHLSQINTVYSHWAQTICENESYHFGDKDYYVDGIYDQTYRSDATGCDSVARLHLTVLPTYNVEVHDTITTEELPYTNLTLVVPVGTEVGHYDYTIESTSEAGCDSVINLSLTITNNVGLESIDLNTLDFYPHVVKGGESITITTNFSEREREALSIRLYDATGKLMATYPPQRSGIMSYTMPKVSGLYYLRLETGCGKTFSGKLIVL